MARRPTRPGRALHGPSSGTGQAVPDDDERIDVPLRFVLFADAGLPDLALLFAGVPDAGRAFAIPRDADAAAFMAGRVAGARRDPLGLEEIGIVAHGGPGHVRIGRQRMCLSSLPGMEDSLRMLGGFLRPTGRLRLLACEAAAGDEGSVFVAALAQTLRRRILAASVRLGNGEAVMDTLVEPNGTIRSLTEQ